MSDKDKIPDSLPSCMMPDGNAPCDAYQDMYKYAKSLEERHKAQLQELNLKLVDGFSNKVIELINSDNRQLLTKAECWEIIQEAFKGVV